MNDEDKCMITLSREDVLKNPEMLKNFYALFGQDQILNWLLKKEIKKPEEQKKEEIDECVNCDSCDSCDDS